MPARHRRNLAPQLQAIPSVRDPAKRAFHLWNSGKPYRAAGNRIARAGAIDSNFR
jgi:hypothetical protein